MFRSISNLNRFVKAFAGASLLALILAGVSGTPLVKAASPTPTDAAMASFSSSYSCAAVMGSSELALRQEAAILSKVTQSNWNVSEVASLGSSNTCASGMGSSDPQLSQEAAILSTVTQSNWNAVDVASLSNVNSTAVGMGSNEEYSIQEEIILSRVTQGNWNPAQIASLALSISNTQAGH